MNFETLLTWELSQSENGERLFSANFLERDDTKIRAAIGEAIEKSVAHLAETIRDDSLYLLFEWDKNLSTLSMVVTDESKQKDSDVVVTCCMQALVDDLSVQQEIDDYAEIIRYWIRDYLTTCTSFFHYSLIAVFHANSRNKTELL